MLLCYMVVIARRDACKERPCVWHNTDGSSAIVSPDGTLIEVPVNHRVALLDVSEEQTYPSQAENTDQFELLVSEERLRQRLRQGQVAVSVISGLEGLPGSTDDRRFGLVLEAQTLPSQDVFVRAPPSMWTPHIQCLSPCGSAPP